jgi:hypothetical protein
MYIENMYQMLHIYKNETIDTLKTYAFGEIVEGITKGRLILDVPTVEFSYKFDSSVFEGYMYDANDMNLCLFFKNDTSYVYRNVPFVYVRNFQTAKSKGRYFHNFLKGKFESIKQRRKL